MRDITETLIIRAETFSNKPDLFCILYLWSLKFSKKVVLNYCFILYLKRILLYYNYAITVFVVTDCLMMYFTWIRQIKKEKKRKRKTLYHVSSSLMCSGYHYTASKLGFLWNLKILKRSYNAVRLSVLFIFVLNLAPALNHWEEKNVSSENNADLNLILQ